MFGKIWTRSAEALYEPRMIDVEQPAAMAAVFDEARSTAGAGSRGVNGARARCVVVVTPGRLLLLQPCPQAGTVSSEQVAGMEKMIPPNPKRNIAAIAYTELTAIQTNIAKAIPFFGMLLGIAYIGHAVWVFEGHPSALAYGCRDADVLLVDGGMLAYLQPDWQVTAASVMRRQEIYVHDRATYRLLRAASAATAAWA